MFAGGAVSMICGAVLRRRRPDVQQVNVTGLDPVAPQESPHVLEQQEQMEWIGRRLPKAETPVPRLSCRVVYAEERASANRLHCRTRGIAGSGCARGSATEHSVGRLFRGDLRCGEHAVATTVSPSSGVVTKTRAGSDAWRRA